MPKAHIIGLGRSGIAAARLLKRESWEVTLSDRTTSNTLEQQKKELECEGITVKLGYALTLNSLELPQLIVVSPGVPWDVPILVEARNRGIETIGEIELAWRYLQSCPWVGITGTNGKTTTTALIAAIFQAAGLNASACGNIGHAACELALKAIEEQGSKGGHTGSPGAVEQGSNPTPYTPPPSDRRERNPRSCPHALCPMPCAPDWVIAEVSSYQIESSFELAPRIGVWTTFTPDHLSRHGTLEHYYKIKSSLLHRSQQQVINGDDPYLHNLGIANCWSNAYWTSVKGKTELIGEPAKGVYIENDWIVAFEEPVLPISSFKMVGVHNQQNLLMAVAVARLVGIEKEAIAQAIATFPGVPHRLEPICTIDGVDFINDSKATNYDAAQVGLASVSAPAILIAGGEAKEGDDTNWIKTIHAKAAAVLLIGEAAPTFAQRLRQSGYEAYEIVETMERAVKRAAELAKQRDARVVLFSPACASFDQYQSFEHRGEHFRELCQQLQ